MQKLDDSQGESLDRRFTVCCAERAYFMERSSPPRRSVLSGVLSLVAMPAVARPESKLTPEFIQIARENKWLLEATKSVGRLEVVFKSKNSNEFNMYSPGSGVIVYENDNVIFVCASHQAAGVKDIYARHQHNEIPVVSGPGLPVSLVMRPSKPIYMHGSLILDMQGVDLSLGLFDMLGKNLNDYDLSSAGLWKGTTEELIGAKVVVCGYPNDKDFSRVRDRMHATAGVVLGTKLNVPQGKNGQVRRVVRCALLTSAGGINGMSGGAAFTEGGKLIGILSGTIYTKPAQSVIVPYSYLIDVLNKTANTNIQMVNSEPAACYFSSKDAVWLGKPSPEPARRER